MRQQLCSSPAAGRAAHIEACLLRCMQSLDNKAHRKLTLTLSRSAVSAGRRTQRCWNSVARSDLWICRETVS